MLNQGLGSWPARRARSRPHRRALVSAHGAMTYGELFARVTRLAHALRGLGLRRGDRIAYLGPNRPSLVETMFAVHTLGGVFVPLNTRLAAPEVDYQLADCGASVLVYSAESAGVVKDLTEAPLLVAVDGRSGNRALTMTASAPPPTFRSTSPWTTTTPRSSSTPRGPRAAPRARR